MRKSVLLVAAASIAIGTASWIGCGSDDTGGSTGGSGGEGGTGGSGNTGNTTTSSSHSSSSSSTGPGGGGPGGSGGSAGTCDAPAVSPSNGACYTPGAGGGGGAGGAGGGGAVVACNPITGEPCDAAAGESCDVGDGLFQCYGPPNTLQQCDVSCNDMQDFCAIGTTCLDVGCVHYCCDDGDCGTGTCVKMDPNSGDPLFTYAPDVGLCIPAQ